MINDNFCTSFLMTHDYCKSILNIQQLVETLW